MAGDFNTSDKPRFSTATKEIEQTSDYNKKQGVNPDPPTGGDPTYVPPIKTGGPSLSQQIAQEERNRPRLTQMPEGAEYMADLVPQSSGIYNNLSAAGQSWWSKLGNTLGRSVLKGIADGVDPFAEGIGAAFQYADIQAGENLRNMDDAIAASVDKAMPVYERTLDEDASFGQKLARFSTLESIVKSAAEFGVMGIGVGATTRGLGSILMKSGTSMEKTFGAIKGAQWANNTLGRAGRAMTGQYRGTVFGNTFTSDAVINGLTTNLLEGRVMAEELRKNMEDYYSNYIYNPEVPDDVKQSIYKNIADAERRLIATNTLIAFSDIFGFSRLGRFTNTNATKKGVWNYIWENVKPMSVTEGAEEIIQSVMQSDAEFKNILDIEREVKNIYPQELSGLDYTGNDYALMESLNPEKAKEAMLYNSMGTLDAFLEQVTDHNTLIEGFAGFFGGGPQWVITGAPFAKKNLKNVKRNIEEQEKFLSYIQEDYHNFSKAELLSEAKLNSFMQELENTTGIKDQAYLKNAVEEYAIARSAIKALINRQEDSFIDHLNTTKEKLAAEKEQGSITEEEFKLYSERINKAQGYVERFKGLTNYTGSQEILNTELYKIALEGAYKAVQGTAQEVDAKAPISNMPRKSVSFSIKAAELIPRGMHRDVFDAFTDEAQTSFIEMIEGVDDLKSPEFIRSEIEQTIADKENYGTWFDPNKLGALKKKYPDAFEEKTEPAKSSKETEKEVEVKAEEVKEDTVNEEFTYESLNKQTIASLENQFGTKKKSTEKKADLIARIIKKNTQQEEQETEQEFEERTTEKDFVDYADSIREQLIAVESSLKYLKSSAGRLRAERNRESANFMAKIEDRLSKSSSVTEMSAIKRDVENRIKNLTSIYNSTLNKLKTERGEVVLEDVPRASYEADTYAKDVSSLLSVIRHINNKQDNQEDLNKKTSADPVSPDSPKGQTQKETIKKMQESFQNLTSNFPNFKNNLENIQFKGKVDVIKNLKSFENVQSYMNGLRPYTGDEKMPPYEIALKQLKEVAESSGGEFTALDERQLKRYYEIAYDQDTEITKESVVEIKKPDFSDSSIPFKAEERGVIKEPEIHTAKSYFLSGLAVSGDTVDFDVPFNKALRADFDLVKAGTNIQFKVLSDEEIEKLEKSDPNFRTFVGTGLNDIQAVTWKEFKKMLPSLDGSVYSEESMRPIQVLYNGPREDLKEQPIGYVHTLQWAEKARKDDVSELRPQVKKDILSLRKQILSKAGKNYKPVDHKIQARNIRLEAYKGQPHVVGATVNRSPSKRNSTVLGDDVVFAPFTPNDTYERDYPEFVNKVVKKGAIVLPGFLTNDKEKKMHSGSLLAFLPMEDSGIYYAEKLTTKKLSEADTRMLYQIITGLGNPSRAIFQKLNDALELEDKTSPFAAPRKLKEMLSSIIFTGGRDVGTDFYDIKVEAREAEYQRVRGKKGQLGKYKLKDGKKIKKKNSPFASTEEYMASESTAPAKLGEIIFTVSLEGRTQKIKYDFMARKSPVKKGKKLKTTFYYTPSNDQQNKRTKENLRAELLDNEKKSFARNPYYNMDSKLMENAQTSNKKTRVLRVAEDGSWTYDDIDYIEDHVKLRSETSVRPLTTTSGKKNYTANTIITVTEPAQTFKGKASRDLQESKRKIKKNETQTKSAEKIQENIIKEEQKFINELKEIAEQIGFYDTLLTEEKDSLDKIEKKEIKAELKKLYKKREELRKKIINEQSNFPTSNPDLLKRLTEKFGTKGFSLSQQENTVEETPKEPISLEQLDIPEPKKYDLIVDDFYAIRSLIKEFNIKYPKGVQLKGPGTENIKTIGDAFNAAERQQLIKSVTAAFNQIFLEEYDNEIPTTNKAILDIYEQTIKKFSGDLLQFRNDLEEYIIKMPKTETMSLDKIAATQYLHALDLVLDGIEQYGQETTLAKEIKAILKKGFAKSLRQIGYYKISYLSEASDSIIEAGESREGIVGEEFEEEEKDQRNKNYHTHSSIMKNPLKKMTTRLKAKLHSYPEYEFVNNQVVLKKSISGGIKFNENAHVILLGILAETSSNTIEEKLETLNRISEEVKRDPETHIQLYFVTELYEDLMKDTGKFTKMEKNGFNVAMNNDAFKALGVDLGNKRLLSKDYNHSSILQNVFYTVQFSLKNLSEAVLTDEGEIKTIKTDEGEETVYQSSVSKKYIEKYIAPYDVDVPIGMYVSNKPYKIEEEVEALHNNIGQFEYQTLDTLTGSLNSLEENFDLVQKRKEGITVAELAELNQKRKEIRKAMADILTDRFVGIFLELGVPLNTGVRSLIHNNILENKDISDVGFHGDTKATSSSYAYLLRASTINLGSFMTTPESTTLHSEFKTILADLYRNNSAKSLATAIRIGTKLVSAYNDRIFAYQKFKELKNKRNDKRFDAYLNDPYAQDSLILDVLSNPEKYGDNMQMAFDLPFRAGLKATWASDLDKADSPVLNSIFNLAHYLSSIQFGHDEKFEEGRIQFPSAPNFLHTIKQGGKTKSYNLSTRIAKFFLPTFSDKDSRFVGDGIDFKASEIVDGKAEVKQEYLEFYVDKMIVPQIKSMLHSAGHSVSGFNPDIFYMTPSLNFLQNEQGETAADLIKELEKGTATPINTLFVENPFRNKKLNTAYNKLRDLAVAAAEYEINRAVDSLFQSYIKNKLLVSSNGSYTFNSRLQIDRERTEDLEVIEDFKKLTESMLEEAQVIDTADPEQLTSAVNNMLGIVMTALETRYVDDTEFSEVFSEKAIEEFKEVFSREKEEDIVKGLKEIFSQAGFKMPLSNVKTLDKAFEVMEKRAPEDADRIDLKSAKKYMSKVWNVNEAFKNQYFNLGYLNMIKSIASETAKKNLPNYTVLNEAKFKSLLMNKEFGQQLYNMNYTQLVSGHIGAAYKKADVNRNLDESGDTYDVMSDLKETYVNYGKRLGSQTSPSAFSEGSRKFKAIIIKDVKRKSDYYDGTDGYGNVNGKNNEGVDAIDGASYITDDTALEDKFWNGEIDEDQIPMLKKFWNSSHENPMPISEKDKGKFSAVVNKPRGVELSSRPVKDGNVNVLTYLKLGQSILNEAKVGTDPTASVHAKMLALMRQLEEKEGMPVMLIPESSIKMGAPADVVDIEKIQPDKDGKYNIPKSAMIESSYNYWGKQQETSHKDGDTGKSGKQMENIAMSAVTNKTEVSHITTGKKFNVRKKWADLLDRLYTIQNGAVNMIMTSNSEQDVMVNLKKAIMPALEDLKQLNEKQENTDERLAAIIKGTIKAFKDEDVESLHPNLFKWLELTDLGKFRHDIAGSPFIHQYVNIIKKTIEKYTVGHKVKMRQLPLESNAFYDLKKAGIPGGSNIILTSDYVDREGPMDRLLPQRVENGVSMPAQILIPWDLTLHDGKRINLNEIDENGDYKYLIVDEETGRTMIDSERLPQDLLKSIGYRTPTQDYGSISYVEVVGFLPPGFKQTVVVPYEYNGIMGSDFDIDKLFLYQYYLRETPEGIRVIDDTDIKSDGTLEYAAVMNEKTKVIQSILNDPDIIKNHISQPLNGEDYFKPFAERLNLITKRSIAERPYLNEEGEEIDTHILSWASSAYQEEKRNNAAAGSESIGIFAFLSRATAMLRFNPIKIREYDSEKKTQVVVKRVLGGAVIESFGGNRPSIFAPSDIEEEIPFDQTKNNTSGLVSTSVDDEKLQINHKMGIGIVDTDVITTLIMAGFKAKTALAIANLPLYEGNWNSDKTRTLKKKLNIKNKTKLNQEEFSMLPTGEGLLQESDFIEDLMELNDRMRTKGIENLSKKDAKDILILKNFVDSIKRDHQNYLRPFNWVFNLDSKGYGRDYNEILKRAALFENPKYDSVITDLKKIPELKFHIDHFQQFYKRLDSLFDRNQDVTDVNNILVESGITNAPIHEISDIIRTMKHQMFKPNAFSVRQRLEAIRSSADPAVVEYYKGNEFLKRLGFNAKGHIVFYKDEGVTPADITESLEELSKGGELAGVDLGILHRDLVDYGLSVRNLTYGNSYVHYIDPEYYDSFALQLPENLPLEKIAAFIAFATPGIPSKGTIKGATIWREKGDNREIGYRYKTPNGVTMFGSITQSDFDVFYRENIYANQALAGLASSERYELDEKTGEIDNVSVKQVTERIFSSKDMIPYKKLFQAAMGEDVTPETKLKLSKTIGGMWDPVENAITLGTGSYSKMKKVLVHEGTHMILQKLIFDYRAGLLGKKTASTVDDAVMNEIVNIFNNMTDSYNRVIQYVAGSVDNYVKADEFQADDRLNPISLLGALTVDTMPLFQSIDAVKYWKNYLPTSALKELYQLSGLRDQATGEVDPATEAEVLNKLGFLHALDNGHLTIENIPGAGDYLFVTGRDGSKKKIYPMDKARALFYKKAKTYLNNHAKLNKGVSQIDRMFYLLKDITDYTMKNPEKSEQEMNYIYALTNLNEYAASVYALGTGAGVSETDLADFVSASEYKPTVLGEMSMKFKSKKLSRYIHAMFQALKKLVRRLVGLETHNTLWGDVLYAKTLARRTSFVVDTGSLIDNTLPYTGLGETILNKCK